MNRRQSLRLIAGALAGSAVLGRIGNALADQGSFRQVSGDVRVGGQPLQAGTTLKPGDVVTTGPDSVARFVVGEDAFELRASSQFALGTSSTENTCRIVRGSLLFSIARDRLLQTKAANIDVGSGAGYLEVDASETYFCLCYGDGVLLPLAAAGTRNAFLSDHHDRPVIVRAAPGKRDAMVTAQLRGHTDAEIADLEALVGRSPPFSAK